MGFLLLASVTDKVVEPVIEVATEFIGSAGYLGVFALMVLESACIPIPSEGIMLFAGFSASKGELTLVGIVAAGVLLRTHRPAGKEQADPHQPQAPELGR
jgi:hypothetical protein